MSDVFEEVEESLRQDKATQLWEKYGWVLYLVGGLIVAFVAAREFMANQAKSAQIERVGVFEDGREALTEGAYADAEKLFADVVSSGADLSPLAAHYLAETRLEGGGDKPGAAKALMQGANSDDPFAKIAVLKAAYLLADTSSLAELEAQLAPVLSDDTPARALALELIAAKAFEEGDYTRARQEFAFLKVAPNAPAGVVVRADAALAVIPAITPDPAQDLPTETNTEEEAGQ